MSKQGARGPLLILFGVLWGALDLWQVADFLPSHMTSLANVLDSWGPLILVAIGLYFVYRTVTSRLPQIRELEIQERWRGQDALNNYFGQMQQLENESRPLATLPREDPRRKMARTRTLEVLKRLDPDGKRAVVQFLYEHELIRGGDPVIRLNTADLSNANLSRMEMFDANLDGVILRDADLSGAKLCQLRGQVASWLNAIPMGGDFNDLLQPSSASSLSRADLGGAVLRQTTLVGCDLIFSDFVGAKLDEADLRAADLQAAQNLTQEQIEQAYGSSGWQKYMRDTKLPEGLRMPEAWTKLLSQQKKERRNL